MVLSLDLLRKSWGTKDMYLYAEYSYSLHPNTSCLLQERFFAQNKPLCVVKLHLQTPHEVLSHNRTAQISMHVRVSPVDVSLSFTLSGGFLLNGKAGEQN